MQKTITKRWKVLERKNRDLIKHLLLSRNIGNDEVESFLKPNYDKDTHDPFLMKGMQEAVGRLLVAIEKKEKVGVFGDYDADGVPGTALLAEILKMQGLEVEVFVPSRDEGYGLNERGLKYLKEKGVTLMVTVDLGVTCAKEVTMALEMGIETIVTDHHEVIIDLLPKDAIAVIDTRQADCKYPFKELCGAAVAFKLGTAISQKSGKVTKDQLKWYLDLVAVSTFCDMVPLVGENRVLVKFGMIVLKKTKRVGLKQLMAVGGIDPDKISEYAISFLIGPRLNAPGRMKAGNLALELLMVKDEERASELANKIETSNKERQALLKKILKIAEEEIIKDNRDEKKVIIVKGDEWPDGIIGLVAGRLMERYGKPAIVLSEQDGKCVGSARSIEGFHLVEMLNKCQELLMKHGGHAKAAGLTVSHEHLGALYDRIWQIADEQLEDTDLVPEIVCDAEVGLDEVNLSLLKKLNSLAPYGMGNKRPSFVTFLAEVAECSTVGNGNNHLKINFLTSNNKIKGIGFDLGGIAAEIGKGSFVDVVYTVDEDNWMGREGVQLKLIDIRRSEK